MAYSDIRDRQTRDIGILDERIELQRQVDIPDGNHGVNPTWEHWKSLWCKRKNGMGRKWNQVANVNVVTSDTRFYIVFNREIFSVPLPRFRILYPQNPKNGESRMIYRVDGVNDVGDSNYFLEIMATGTTVETG